MQALILGGARSGKSAYAENLARQSGHEVVYIATAEAQDARDAGAYCPSSHQSPDPLALAATLQQQAAPGRLLLVDCLTPWLTNLLCLDDKTRLSTETAALLECLPGLPGDLLLVSNEVSLGVVPLGELTRQYVDEAGRQHQQLATQLEAVVFMVAGLPQALKGEISWNG